MSCRKSSRIQTIRSPGEILFTFDEEEPQEDAEETEKSEEDKKSDKDKDGESDG